MKEVMIQDEKRVTALGVNATMIVIVIVVYQGNAAIVVGRL